MTCSSSPAVSEPPPPPEETAAAAAAEEPKPIDLLEVTGAGAMAKKYGPYVLLGLVVLVIVLWLALR